MGYLFGFIFVFMPKGYSLHVGLFIKCGTEAFYTL